MSDKERGYDKYLKRKGARLESRINEGVPFCWMCSAQSGNRAKEHIFPLWLQRELGAEKETWTPTHTSVFGDILDSRGPHPTTALLAGEICEACNGGWMNALEGRFRKVMFPRCPTIGEADGRVIAHWFAKTAIVINSAQNYRLAFPREARHAAQQGVPPGVGVFLGQMPNAPDRLNFIQVQGNVFGFSRPGMGEMAQELLKRAYCCVIRIDEVVAAVVYAPPGPWAWPLAEMTQLHPWRGEEISWESLPPISDVTEPLMLYAEHPDL